VNAAGKNWFRCQIAVAMSLARHGLPWFALPLRDNFPNIDGFERRQPDELAAVRIAHYLNKTETLNKSRDFNDRLSFMALLQRQGLQGLEARIQQTLKALLPCPLDEFNQRLRARLFHPIPKLVASDGYI